MSLTLGQKLRQAREERGISISEVSEQTRISPHYIESIENDDYKTLPGGIFNKGFVKSYARYIGFDEHEALSDYSRAVSQTDGFEGDEPKVYRPEVLTDDHYSSSRWPSLVVAALILALMTGGVLYLVNYIQNRSDTPTGNASTTPTPSQAATGESPAANNTAAPTTTAAPTMGDVVVQFAASTEVSLSSVNDGNRSQSLVKPGSPIEFRPKESLLMRFYGPLAGSISLTINGKPIELPTAPPVKGVLSIQVDSKTLPELWQSGRVAAEPEPAATARPAANTRPKPSPTPTRPRPSPTAPASPRQ